MSGLLNLFYPPLDALDTVLGPLPAALRLVVFGALSGALAMALYRLFSNQERIRARKAEIREIRVALKAAADDFDATMRLSRRNLAASFRLLGAVILPAILSSLPLLIVLAWLAGHYEHHLPAPGAPVPIAFAPGPDGMRVEPEQAVVAGEHGPLLLWPAAGETRRFVDPQGLVYAGPPPDVAASIVHKRRWWNWLLGNEAGYLRDDAGIEAITLALPERTVLPGVPSWLGGWEAIYFLSIFATSLLIKAAFRIE